MEEKSTSQLNEELLQASSLSDYVNGNRAAFTEKDVAELLSALYEKKKLSKAALARKAGMSEIYLHQVFSGRRKPCRDFLDLIRTVCPQPFTPFSVLFYARKAQFSMRAYIVMKTNRTASFDAVLHDLRGLEPKMYATSCFHSKTMNIEVFYDFQHYL